MPGDLAKVLGGSKESPGYDAETEAYVDDLQAALDAKDGRKLYDAICAVVQAEGARSGVTINLGQ